MSSNITSFFAPFTLALIASLVAGTAWADSVSGTRSELLVERSHSIRATLYRDHAELVVRRTVFNGGPRHDQAMFRIELPASAVATGLRTLGSVSGRPHWFSGELMEAEAAAARYRELTGIGGYYPKDPALLSWRSQELLVLQVFPCPPAAEKTIEYTLKIPTVYEHGAHHVRLPALGTEKLVAELMVRAADPRERVLVDGQPLAADGSVPLGRKDELDLALVPRQAPVLGGRLVVVPIAERRAVTRFDVQLAPRVSSVPRGARVVVALDGSRSVASENFAAARVAADAYLSHFSDAQVEVLVFDRKLHRRHGRFVSPALARADLGKLAIEPANGSDVDRALSEADRLLAATPRGTARRIVLMTDGHTRSKLSPERLRAAVAKSGAIVHLGIVNAGDGSLARDDEHDWSAAIRSSGGLVWKADAPSEPVSDDGGEALRAVYEEWARPLRVDRLRFFSAELAVGSDTLEGFSQHQSLDEGEAIENLFIAERALRSLAVEGELWAEPVRTTFMPDLAKKKLWAALAFGSPLLDELSEAEMMPLAMLGGAVTPVTSYLAIEPGVRPSTEGLEWGVGLGGIGSFGSGSGRGMGLGSGQAATFDRAAFLKRALAPEWKRCGGTPGTASVKLETTLAEIVDVEKPELMSGSDARLERCLSEAVWALELPVQFREEWNEWTVVV